MSKQTEALKLALNKAFQLGQRYWSWADSEYSSHWKKADAAKAEFDQLVQDTINAALAEYPAQDNTYGYAKNLAEAIFKQHFASDEHYASGRIVWGVSDTVIGILTQIDNMVSDMVRRPEQPSRQEPFSWADLNALTAQFNSVNCGTAYRLPGEGRQPLYTSPQAQPAQQEPVTYWDLSENEMPVRPRLYDPEEHPNHVPLYTSTPAQRKPLTHEQRVDLLAKFEANKHEWHAPAILIDMVEAAHGIAGEKK